MIPIYICDDEILLLKQLQQVVSDQVMISAYDMGPIYTFSSPEELLSKINSGSPRGIYFLDIDFPGQMNGFQLAQRIRSFDPRGFIIFITGHDDLAVETFRYQLEAMDYVVKGDDKLITERIQTCLANAEARILAESKENTQYYTLKISDTVRHIPLSRILYFEAIGRKHLVLLRMTDEMLEFYGSLTAIEEEVGERFWRCHRGYLVNREHIHEIHLKENSVELTNGERCLLSRRAKLNVLK
ncbi:MAG: LytTR family DNA-binding domain-containing protein [Eubacteriales bacterium]|nr:LytTR family DNA-binding domain-containing protein [Eubacteriales bacterium]